MSDLALLILDAVLCQDGSLVTLLVSDSCAAAVEIKVPYPVERVIQQVCAVADRCRLSAIVCGERLHVSAVQPVHCIVHMRAQTVIKEVEVIKEVPGVCRHEPPFHRCARLGLGRHSTRLMQAMRVPTMQLWWRRPWRRL